jgi:uncharacterized protein (DUF4415 family)
MTRDDLIEAMVAEMLVAAPQIRRLQFWPLHMTAAARAALVAIEKQGFVVVPVAMLRDIDSPELTDEELARLRPAREVLSPELFEKLVRGRPMMRDNPEFAEHSRRERGRPLTGRYAHYCRDWDLLTIDETCPEWPCGCGIEEYVDASGPGWRERLRTVWRGFLIGLASPLVWVRGKIWP